MPLYTYIVSYKGHHAVAQARRSNFRGFPTSWLDELSPQTMPGLTPELRSELAHMAYRAEFIEVPNRRHVWRTVLRLGGSDLTVYAVRTDD